VSESGKVILTVSQRDRDFYRFLIRLFYAVVIKRVPTNSDRY
jgi:hypothetical protein